MATESVDMTVETSVTAQLSCPHPCDDVPVPLNLVHLSFMM